VLGLNTRERHDLLLIDPQSDQGSLCKQGHGPRAIADGGDPPQLRACGSRSRAGTYLHTTHHASRVRICYHHHPFFGQTVEIIRWLRRQTAESLVIQLPEGLERAMPAWRLDPLACRRVCDAPAPRLSIAALLALRALRAHQPWLRAALPAPPCVAQPEGARDAPESASAPTAIGPLALPQRRVGPAAHRQAPAGSRAPRPPAHPRQPQCPERGVEPGAPRCPRAIANGMPTSLSARRRAIQSAPTPRASGGPRPAPSRPAGWGWPRSA
jgi:hypothetical protein